MTRATTLLHSDKAGRDGLRRCSERRHRIPLVGRPQRASAWFRDRIGPAARGCNRRSRGNNSAFAAKAATAIIPIVFTSGADPVKVGLVASLNRPGANLTGVAWFAAELGPKFLAVLGELVPNITVAAVMVNPESPETAGQVESSQQAARVLGWQLLVHEASSPQGNRRRLCRDQTATCECRHDRY